MKYKILSGTKKGGVAALVSNCMLPVRNWCAPYDKAQIQKLFCRPQCGANRKAASVSYIQLCHGTLTVLHSASSSSAQR